MGVAELVERYGIDRSAAETLAAYGFDAERFDRLRGRLTGAQHAGGDANRVLGHIEPPADDDLTRLPPSGTAERDRLAEVGREAIAAGQVGVLLLAGGMATRFGGGVKALAEALPGLTFAAAKLADLRRLADELGCAIPLWLMTSFQSDDVLRDWAAASASAAVRVGIAPQGVSIRLTPGGELFRNADGAVSLYAPGHGDAPWAMQQCGLLDEFARSGGRHLFVTNVDNAAATLDPAVIGAHLARAATLTCEVVEGHAPGGSPWRVDGHLQIVETFRLPPGIDPLATGAANTNSLIADIGVFEASWPLTWFEVRKQVDGVDVVQFERLIGELSAFTDTSMLLVPAGGPDGRFQPVKDPAELEARRPEISRILSGRGVAIAR